jgi:hypothetical protein
VVSFILYRADLLLDNDLETNYEPTSAARQQILNNQVYAAVTEEHFRKQTCFHGNDWSKVINGAFYEVRAEVL